MSVTLLVATLLAPCGEVVPLTTKAHRTWRIALPADPFRAVSGRIPVPHAGGDGFAVESRGSALAVDTDGDGEVDRVLEGTEDPVTRIRHARVTLESTTPAGAAFKYPVRFMASGSQWKWAAGGTADATLAGTSVRLVDLDGNGRIGDVGTDAIVVGDGDVAQYFGEVIHAGGELVSIAVGADGASLVAKPYTGPRGVLDLRSSLDAKGVLLSAVVQSLDGRHSFELSAFESGAAVPAGRYRLVGAELGRGSARVSADASAMEPIEVAGDAKVALAWGGPVRATFDYAFEGGQLVLSPDDVAYVGRAGERWVGWDPIGKSPTFQVKEKTTGNVLVDVVFPGSC